jgi:hypothetical protein
MKNLEIGYTLPNSAIQKLKISRFRVYANATNLFTVDKMGVGDPENVNKDFTAYPLRRVINFGISATF